MRFHLLHAGTLVGVAELHPEAPPAAAAAEAWRPVDTAADVTLVGALTPTAAYSQIRPLLQQLLRTAAAAAPDAGAPAPKKSGLLASIADAMQLLWQVATLPLTLTRRDGTMVATERLLVLDAGGVDAMASAPMLTVVVSAEEARRLEVSNRGDR